MCFLFILYSNQLYFYCLNYKLYVDVNNSVILLNERVYRICIKDTKLYNCIIIFLDKNTQNLTFLLVFLLNYLNLISKFIKTRLVYGCKEYWYVEQIRIPTNHNLFQAISYLFA